MKTKYMNRNLVVSMIVLAMVLMIPGYGITPVHGADKIKIGTITPISGPLSILGMSFGRGYQLLADTINEKGGVNVGGKRYLLEIINEDSKMNAEASRASALKLVHRDKANFIVGGILESVMEAIYKVCSEAGVLYAQQNANIPGHPADISPDKMLQVRVFHSHDETHDMDIKYLKTAYCQ